MEAETRKGSTDNRIRGIKSVRGIKKKSKRAGGIEGIKGIRTTSRKRNNDTGGLVCDKNKGDRLQGFGDGTMRDDTT